MWDLRKDAEEKIYVQDTGSKRIHKNLYNEKELHNLNSDLV